VLDVRDALRGTAAASVSLADLIQLAGAHAVALTGGPRLRVPLGRTDAASPDPPGRLPEETLDGAQLRAHFAASGLTAREMVALSGAHTIGGKGFGAPLSFDNVYFRTLLAAPWADGNATPEAREMASHIGLPSDKALPGDAVCRGWIERYAADEAAWLSDFSAAYIKMGTLGAVWAPGVTPPAVETRA
jgi:L-ascorbate peroxidase